MTSSFELLSCTRFDPFLANLRWNHDNSSGSPFFLLHYHLDRLKIAARQHGWTEPEKTLSWRALQIECNRVVEPYKSSEEPSACKVRVSYRSIICDCNRDNLTITQIRFVLAESGALTATATPVKPFTSDPTSASFFKPDTDYHSLYGPPIRICVDSEPTPNSKFTSTKTTNRSMYDAARTRGGVPPFSSTPSSNAGDTSPPDDILLFNPQHMITETSIYNVAFYRSNRWVTPPESSGCLPGVLRRWLLEQGRIYEAEENLLTRDSIIDGECVLLVNGVQGCQLGRIVFPPNQQAGEKDASAQEGK